MDILWIPILVSRILPAASQQNNELQRRRTTHLQLTEGKLRILKSAFLSAYHFER